MNSALKEAPVGPNETLSIFPWYFQLKTGYYEVFDRQQNDSYVNSNGLRPKEWSDRRFHHGN